MDGLLVVDKPVGPSSHDIVARVRRVLKERRIGHTGTLDPQASGVLALVVGRATRLARFLSSDRKHYEAVVRLGLSTNTYDAAGQPTSAPYEGLLPSQEAIDAALDAYRGTFLQRPPVYSAKKIGGEPSYKLARRRDRRRQALRAAGDRGDAAEVSALGVDESPEADTSGHHVMEPARVDASVVKIVKLEGPCLTLHIECSAGFYVRSLAHDLGDQLRTGAHLIALRRTRSGVASLDEAVGLATLEDPRDGRDIALAALIPLAGMLQHLPAVTLTTAGVQHAVHGRTLEASDLAPGTDVSACADGPHLRLLDASGGLVGLGATKNAPGTLHPFVVLM